MKNLIYRKKSLFNGILALSVIGLIAFGCVCDDLDERASENSETDTTNEVVAENVIPSDAKAKEMVKTKMLEFADAFETGNYSTLISTFAEPLQKQITSEKIDNSFREFLKKIEDAKLNIRSIESLKLEFMVKPFINDRKFQRPTLFLIGHYPTNPLELDFDFTYIFEDNDWKLVGYNIRENDMSAMRSNPDKDDLEVPSSGELQKLIETDLGKVKDAIDRNDFSLIQKQVSKNWQRESTSATFEKMFAFSGKMISLGINDIPGKSPKYTIEPHINIRNYNNPTLVVNGFYETSPNQVSFNLNYISEDGKWKLNSLGLSPGTPKGIPE